MENLELAIQEIKEAMPGLTLLENEPMSGHCSFRIGGPARALAVPRDITGLTQICYLLKKHELAPYILGNGTNILFPDEGLKDLFLISTEKLDKIFLLPDGAVYAEAGVSLSKLATFALIAANFAPKQVRDTVACGMTLPSSKSAMLM